MTIIRDLYAAIEALAVVREAGRNDQQALALVVYWRDAAAGAQLDLDPRGWPLLNQTYYFGWVELRQLVAQLQRLGWSDQVRTLREAAEVDKVERLR